MWNKRKQPVAHTGRFIFMFVDEITAYLHQPRTVCLPHVITYSLFWFFPGITSNLMLVSPIPWFLREKQNSTDEVYFHTHTRYMQQWEKTFCVSHFHSVFAFLSPILVIYWCLYVTAHLLRHSWRIWYGESSPALLVSSYTLESSILIWLKYCGGECT